MTELMLELNSILDAFDERTGHEVVCIDDGNTDDTLERLKELVGEYPFLKVVSLSRNFGHQAAVTAGFDHCSGEVAFVIDGDLQDDPGVLPRFIEEYRKGADVLYAQRIVRKESILLRAAYAMHYRSFSSLALPSEVNWF